MEYCDKCGGIIIQDEDFVYSIRYDKCLHCGKRFNKEEKIKMNILVKIPTRGRPAQLFSMLELYLKFVSNPKEIRFLISMDEDDKDMNNENIKDYFKAYELQYKIPLILKYGVSNNKIHAINRDINDVDIDWDILILASDDMLPLFEGYDKIIKNDMSKYFPDKDGILFYPDGYTNLNTLPIIGKKYYEKFNYVYNPVYESFFCDNEFHIVADLLDKQYHSSLVLFRHEHPANTGTGWDEVYEKNNTTWVKDEKTFNQRAMKNFEIK